MAKKKKLTEKEIDKLFVVAIGFNVPDGDGEKRFNVGTDAKPNFVTEKDFKPEHWKELVKQGAVVQLVQPETEAEKDETAFEIIED